MKKENLKSQIVSSAKNPLFTDLFIKNYFDINKEYEEGYPYTVFFDSIPEGTITERNVIISNDYENNEYEKINFEFTIPENVLLKTPKELLKLENEKKILFNFIPTKEKIKIKKLIEEGQSVYSDKSIYTIL